MFLNINQRALYAIMLDYQQMKQSDNFEMSISYICKNMEIANEKAQKIINELIQLNLISKSFNKGKTTTYSINKEKIIEFDLLSNDEIFELRDKKTKTVSIKKNHRVTGNPLTNEIIKPVEEVKQVETVQAPEQPILKAYKELKFNPTQYINEEEIEEDSEEDEIIESIYNDDEINNKTLINKFQNFIQTNNNYMYLDSFESMEHITEHFELPELLTIKKNINQLKENNVIPRKRIERIQRDLMFMNLNPVKQQERIYEPNF
jgi:hypothetical protein